ncbi:MAG TPA: nucleotidyltransferase family protein [bacterium]|nr:nucleotidyltransferase family protein [bacterium]HOL47076.1 nucleotidyltransferase family protein [bacterium]HPQ18976.1 nucleotidyltransferase family protein [bacterium]
MKNDIVAIILAAGLSSRMANYPKPLIKYKNKFFLEYIINNLLKSEVKKIIIVLGYKKEIILKYFSNTEIINFIFNEEYEKGQFSSLIKGIKYLQNLKIDYNYVLLTLCDIPLVKYRTYKKLIESVEEDKIIIPSYNRQCGHPIIFDKKFIDYFLKEELTSNAKNVINKLREKVKYVDVNDEKILKDYDSINDFQNYNFKFLDFLI